VKNLTDSVAWSTPIQVPEDSIDLVNGASVETTTLQRLANRTAYLREFVDAQSPITRTVRISPSRGIVTGTAGVNYTLSNGISVVHNANGPSSKFFVDFTDGVPTGATITAISWRVIPGAARATSGDRMQAGYEITANDATVTASSVSTDDGTAAAQSISFSPLAIGVNHATSKYCAWIYAGADAATYNDLTLYLEVSFVDPGARNY